MCLSQAKTVPFPDSVEIIFCLFSKAIQMFDAERFHVRNQPMGSFNKPGKGFFANFIVLRVPRFDISLIQDVEPR